MLGIQGKMEQRVQFAWAVPINRGWGPQLVQGVLLHRLRWLAAQHSQPVNATLGTRGQTVEPVPFASAVPINQCWDPQLVWDVLLHRLRWLAALH